MKDGFGQATYYKKLMSIPKSGIYGLRLRVDTAFRAFMFQDGERPKLVAKMGKLGRFQKVPQQGDPLFTVPLKKGNYHFVIQVQNYDYADGVIWKSPTLQIYREAVRVWNAEAFSEIMAFGIILIITIYNIFLYFNRREGRHICGLPLFVPQSFYEF